MSVKIINVLKDDSFNDILELFRQSNAGEVILVLPRVGKLFRHEDHFAAFASEAQQAQKTVSVLTSNADTAQMARKFGFGVMTTGAAKMAKPSVAALATAPPPADHDTRDFSDTADLGDVPLTADQTQQNAPDDEEDTDPRDNMHLQDEDGNPIDDDGDGKPDKPSNDDMTVGDDSAGFVSSPAVEPGATLASAAYANSRYPRGIDDMRLAPMARRNFAPDRRDERAAPVPIRTEQLGPQSQEADLDYIDAVWRERKGADTPLNIQRPPAPSWWSRSFSGTARIATGTKSSRRILWGILGAALVVLAAIVFLMSGSARVTLAPVAKPVDSQITVQSSDVFTTVDNAFAKIPGQLIDITKTESSTVPASGKRDVASKARGKITVYNEYSSSPQALVATTRFESSSGKVFRTLQNITVPGSTISAGKTVAGKATIDVVADAPGPAYNIETGKFVIVAFREKGDTEKVTKFYGASDAAMTGGASGPSPVVTQADYDKALDAASAAVGNAVVAAMKSSDGDLLVLDAEATDMSNITSTARADDAADSVTVTVSGAVKTIAFRKADLTQLIVASILAKERLVVLPDKLKLSYTDIAFKEELGILVFTVTAKGTGFVPLDTDAIRRDISGKNADRIREYFKDKEGIQTATVTLSPFWVRSVPTKTQKIAVELVYADDGAIPR